MKFKKLFLSQITSYRNQSLIDFDQVTHQNLFIISGDTGSGKSTILNSITFALFGRCHQSNVNHVDLVSLGMPQGEIKLIFEHEFNYYSAEVLIRCKTKSGKPLKVPKVSRNIYQRESASINSNVVKTFSNLDEILDLSFDQFSNSVILNQGKFNQFLFSSFTKRKEILEDFYNSFNLQKISQNLFIELKLINEKVSNFSSQQENLNLQLQQLPPNLEELKSKQLNFIESKSRLLKSKKTTSLHLNEIIIYSNKFHQTNLKFKELQNEVVKLSNKLSEENEAYRKQLQINKTKLDKISEEEKTCLRGIKQENELNLLEQNIKNKKQELVSLRHQLNSKRSEQVQERKKKYELNELSSNLIKELSLKPHHDYLKNYFFDKTKITNLRMIRDLDQLLWSKENEILKVQKNKAQIEKQIVKELESEKNIKSTEELINLKNNEERLQETKEEIINLQNQLKNKQILSQKIKELSSIMMRLMHQTAQMLNDPSSGRDIELLKNSFNRFLIQGLKHKIGHESKKAGKCLVCHSPINKNHAIQTVTNSSSSKVSFKNIDKVQENISQIMDINKEITTSKNTISQTNHIEHNLHKYNKTLTELSNKVKCAQELKANLKSIQLICQRYQEQISQFESILALKKKEYIHTKLKINSILEKDFPLNKVLLNQGILFHMAQKIGTIEKYHIISDQNEFLKEKILQNSTRIAELKQKIKKESLPLKDLIKKHYQLKCDFESVFPDISPSVRLQQIENHRETIREQINDKKSLISEFEKSLLLQNSQVSLQESNLKEYEQVILTNINQFNLVSSKSIAPHDLPFPKEKISYFTNLLEMIKKSEQILEHELNLAQKEAGKISEQLKQMTFLYQQIDKLKSQQNNLYQEKQILEDLQLILGRDQFRNFVLAKIENNLIKFTNRELIKLAGGRYQLKQITNKYNQSDYYIIDKYSDGLERKVNTLSGGEVFIVSICMAFALSELNRGKVNVESLFIDEGFGHLDKDNLEDIVYHLKNLNQKGKIIGIISHITELKEKINSGIYISKNEGHSSQVNYF